MFLPLLSHLSRKPDRRKLWWVLPQEQRLKTAKQGLAQNSGNVRLSTIYLLYPLPSKMGLRVKEENETGREKRKVHLKRRSRHWKWVKGPPQKFPTKSKNTKKHHSGKIEDWDRLFREETPRFIASRVSSHPRGNANEDILVYSEDWRVILANKNGQGRVMPQ